MIILFDEDMGTKIPKFLHEIGLRDIRWVCGQFHTKEERADTSWLTVAGQKRWLVFSCNKGMLNVQDERETIIRERVGVVYLTSGQELLPAVLRLVLNKWDWFERIDREVERPFAFYLFPSGRVRQVALAP